MKKNNDNLYQEAVDRLLEMYQKGEMPEAVSWSIIRRRKGEVAIPSDKWSIGNQMLMYAYGTADARGFKQWNSVNRFVKQGSRAIHILAPCTKKITVKNPDTGMEEEKIFIAGFRPIPVFRIEDTDGEPVPVVDYTPEELPPLWEAAENLGIPVTYMPMCRAALGTYKLNENKVNLYSKDAVVYFHELAHAVEHNFVHNLTTLDGEIAEATAEFAAMVLCQITGIEGYEKQGFEYIARYAGKKKKTDKAESVLKMIMSIMSDVEKIVNIILDAAEGILPNQKTPALEAV